MSLLPEVLAPVGSPESLAAAVRSGANAIYIGAKRFSARRNADNFAENDIKETVEYCHIRGVKVYLALNIMIKQSELKSAFETAAYAYKCGVDAVIISDLGLASLLHKYIPKLQLHASTQMTVHSPACLQMLKNFGFTRVVVSREMSRSELEIFCKAANNIGIEVEVFVHGALCMSVSGQCLLSSILGGRSGNRGLCAGPCRLPFKVSGGTGYDLSLKDLCLYEHITDLKNMGVASLKIEGRMKRPEYVSAATAACRQAVDNGFVDETLFETLKNVFSRSGFTDGYYKGNLGINMFGTRTKDDVIASSDTYAYLHNIYRAERQSVPIEMQIKILQDKPIVLNVNDGVNKVTVFGDVPQTAKNKPSDKQNVTDNLLKLGNTPYYCKNADVNIESGLFVSASQINAIRREAIEKLNFERRKTITEDFDFPLFEKGSRLNGKKQFIARFSDFSQMPENLENLNAVILPYDCDIDSNLTQKIKVIAELPRYIPDETVVVNQLKKLRSEGVDTVYCNNLSALALATKNGFFVLGGLGFNVNNTETVSVLNSFGVAAQMLSAEISLKEISDISSKIPVGIFAYGRLPLMLTRNCPLKNGRTCAECDKNGFLTDRKGIRFPVKCRKGYSEILNSKPLYMGDRLNEIPNVDFLLLYFTDESATETEKIINMYLTSATPNIDFTRNLYYRDLI